ncbi:type II secretion system F family protein [Phenylobacterium soli]|uniref:Pilus assembly protein TadB n=1 Tax=Phenylobacterium soli TaxID=2170551 RepID=A0A328AHE2_9CAUL|nr:type II secretion system F family protein [Phenylobacterium soli]RAK53971.1 pilus assembly protein TadB [Phenylobacterium soli]
MEADWKTLFMVLVGAAVFTGAQAAIGLLTTATERRKLTQRLKVAEKVDGLSAVILELRKQRGLNASGERAGRLQWLSDLIVASGLPYDQKKWLTYAIAAAGIAGAGGFVLTHNPLAIPVGAVLGGVAIPIFYLKFMAGRRAKALGFQLPQALEIIVRSLEAGHPVPTAIALVGREMSDPVGSEFGMAADEIAYGATLEQAIARMSERCQHPDVDLFAATVRLQERAGGNLTGLLKLNAATVRDRHKMRLKIKAASAEGRASAMILTSAPFVAFGLINLTNPHFYGDVSHEPLVRYGLMGLLVWLGVGNLVMRKMIDMRL